MPAAVKIYQVRARRGFSLIELLMVISVIAILAGAAVPSFRNTMKNRALDDGTRLMVDILRYARSVAIERGLNAKITVNPETSELVFSVETDPLNAPDVYQPEPFPIRLNREAMSRVQFAQIMKNVIEGTQQENEIMFNPDGSTADTMIYLTNENQRVHSIGIVGLTGQVMHWDRAVENYYAE